MVHALTLYRERVLVLRNNVATQRQTNTRKECKKLNTFRRS